MNIESRILVDYKRLCEKVKRFKYRRYLFNKIAGVKDYFVGIAGIRGIGKTTLLLQLSLEKKNAIYFSYDSIYLKPYSLFDVIERLIRMGYKHIFIDEIHQAKDWARVLKTIYDTNEVNIYFSGSSSINLIDVASDLSRRAIIFNLKPISFREFLLIRKGIELSPLSFEKIIKNKYGETYITSWPYLEEYMKAGGVLYPLTEGFEMAVINSLNKMIKDDLASVKKVDLEMEDIAYKLVFSLATSKPYELSYSSLSSSLGVSKKTVISLVSKLSEIGLFLPVYSCGRGIRVMRKEAKIYMPFPFRSVINTKIFSRIADIGVLREEFFVNHVARLCFLKSKGKKVPDFMHENISFEIGGKSKSRYQKADYLVVDEAYAGEKKIPLYIFGFMY